MADPLIKSIDEETSDLVDIYDGLISPKSIWRNNNNKLYLIFHSFAAGLNTIRKLIVSLRNRFNPWRCDEEDLISTATLVGTKQKEGSGSVLRVTVHNTSSATVTLDAGIYNFASSSGMVFSFNLSGNYNFAPDEQVLIPAVSREKGSFRVNASASLSFTREDGGSINGAFIFSCEDNERLLGYLDESLLEFRKRLINDTERQDELKELELAIRNLPTILECNLILNQDIGITNYDGYNLQPYELLVVVHGVPTDDLARLVASRLVYATHEVNPAQVVYYENERYAGGRYPVYFAYHQTTDFSLTIIYQYNSKRHQPSFVESEIDALFADLIYSSTHTVLISEGAMYERLNNLTITDVKILDVKLTDSTNTDVSYIFVPSTRLPNLTGITYTAVEEFT